ncbi:MAG: 30S ribosome-binding factor RbfA [candidate division Zixibacteria bacterium]|nr:30S ribosome-binding factor RbfA [candidate division Zixibacteria bacterium]MCI0596849.1 30S ribosome-binding factor RbfA [candidate division Zixibacteria bacterium]
MHALSELLASGVRDAELGFVTLTGAELSPDLKNAVVFYSVLGDAVQQEKTARVLGRSAHLLQGMAARQLGLRYTPRLVFRRDESIEKADRIERLLKEIKDERKDGPSG